MKKAVMVVILGLSLAMLFQLGGNAYALEWVLYDDFESGVINTDKWDIDSSSANITIEGGKAKFVHNAGTAGDAAWLKIKKRPERITGIKATVTIASGAGNLWARVAGFIGDYGDDRDAILASTNVQTRSAESGGDRIFAHATALDRTTEDYAYMYDLNLSQFWNPIDVIGEELTIEMHFDETKYAYSVEGLGGGSFKFPEALRKGVELTKGILTWSNDALGSGTVYFDNVYVLRERPADIVQPKVKSISPVDGAKNVPIDTQITIKFNEPMKNETFIPPGEAAAIYPPGSTLAYEYPNSFIITLGQPLPPGEWFHGKIGKGWLQDAAGNPNEGYSFSFKTRAPL